MNLTDIQQIFNRALTLTFSAKKLLLISCLLALCGLLVVFSRGLAVNASYWMTLSLTFTPLFLCTGILLSAGIVLTRIYHNEIKGKEVNYTDILSNSWETIIAASYFSIPIVLIYLLLWMILGIFVLLKEIPGVGDFFTAILAFAPFLLNLSSLLLCIFALLVLYFVTPIVSLKGGNRIQLANSLTARIKGDAFCNLLLGALSILPLIFSVAILAFAAFLTESMYGAIFNSSIYTVIHTFFMMIPFAIMLSPAVIFFFNFAAEAHVLMRKMQAS